MADLSDVTAYLAGVANSAVYPSGTSQPSITGAACRVYEGWPMPANLDADIAAGIGNVSIFPMQGTGIQVYQILDQTYTIVDVSYGLTVGLANQDISNAANLLPTLPNHNRIQNWAPNGVTINVGAYTAPDGTLTADGIIEDTGNSSHGINSSAFPLTAQPTTIWFEAKSAGRWLYADISDGVSNFADAWIDLTNLAFGTTHNLVSKSVSDLGNGWRLVQMTFNGWTAASNNLSFLTSTGNGTIVFPGDGVSGVLFNRVLVAYGTTDELVSQPTITLAGAPRTGEYLTVIADRAHVYSATGVSAAAIIASIAAAASVDYPGTLSTSTTLTIPAEFDLVVRQGGVGTLGRVTHRQRHSVMVSVWAPTPTARTTLAKAIDNLIKQNNKVSMPDTSQALVCYSRTNITDEIEKATIYRRDLIYDVEYATVEEFPGYVITSVDVSITDPTNTAIANAITGGETIGVGVVINPGGAPLLDFSLPGDSQYLPLV